MLTELKLTGSNVLIERLDYRESLYNTFLALPDSYRFDGYECEVLAVGPGEVTLYGREEMTVKPGDRVVVFQGMGEEIEKNKFIVDVADIWALRQE